MLNLGRKAGQWVNITHKSGDVLRVRINRIEPNHVDVGFDDAPRNFDVQRPERKKANEPATA